MLEFTGERLVPDKVERDLWNEHIARYLFASRLAKRKRVLDIACGLGYGSAELAKSARTVCAIDIATQAVVEASRRYQSPNLSFMAASATRLPFPDASFDLIVAFEVIEHLEEWPALLSEARRLIAPGGQVIISTPNQSFYAQTRKTAGPNPFHVHEFQYAEFREALRTHFSSVTLYLQNHAAVISIQPDHAHHGLELAVEEPAPNPETSHFFLAVCAMSPQTGSPLYVYLPAAANVLKEREDHIAKLRAELDRKDEWLQQLKQDHAALLTAHHELEDSKAKAVAWAQRLDEEIDAATRRIADLDNQILEMRTETDAMVAAYETKITELESELTERTEALAAIESRMESELRAKAAELAKCVDLLHDAEAMIDERTRWAQSLDVRIAELESIIAAAGSSRWVRLGRRLGVGPHITP